MNRIFNFSAGPAQLPLEVLREAQEELLDYRGTGMSVMEMSHRGKEFGKIISEAEAVLREIEDSSRIQDFVFTGRRTYAICDGADESHEKPRRGLYFNGALGEKSRQGSLAFRKSQYPCFLRR